MPHERVVLVGVSSRGPDGAPPFVQLHLVRPDKDASLLGTGEVADALDGPVIFSGGSVQLDPDPRPLGKVCGPDEGDDSRRVTRPQLNAFAESEPRRQNRGGS